MKLNKIIIIVFFLAVYLQNSCLMAQDSTSSDENKTIKNYTYFISAYVGGLNYPKQPEGTDYSYYSNSSKYSSYEFESPTFGIGVGYDVSKSLALEFRYSNLGKLAIVNKVGNYANYSKGKYQGHTFINKDNKTTIDLSVLELYLKWYYYSKNVFKGTAYNGDISFGLGAAPTYEIFDVSIKDGDYQWSKQIQDFSFMLMPFAVTYRFNNNILISGSYHTIFAYEYGYIGLQYYFN